MSAPGDSSNNREEKSSETIVQTMPTNLAPIQSNPSSQALQSHTNQNPSLITQVVNTSSLVGKSISVDLNTKILMKSPISNTTVSSAEYSKLISTVSSTPPIVRLISPNVTGERPIQTQNQQQSGLQGQQPVSNVPTSTSVHHVPRGPAAVATLTTPRSTIATFKVGSGEPVILRTVARIGGANNTQPQIQTRPLQIVTTSQQWPSKGSIVYTQQSHPRHPVPVATSRQPTRPSTPNYTAQTSSRLVTPAQPCRPVQRMVVTTPPSTNVTELLVQNHRGDGIARIPANPNRPQFIQVAAPASQTNRPATQTLQANQTNRPLPNTTRISLPTSVIGTQNRIPSGALQTLSGKKVTIGASSCTLAGVTNRIVIPQHCVQTQQQGTPSILQPTGLVTTQVSNVTLAPQEVPKVNVSLANCSINTRPNQSVPTSVARITSMSLHSLPLTPARATPVPLKVTQTPNIPVQLKTIQQTGPSQQQPPQTQNQQQTNQQQSQLISQQQVQTQSQPPQQSIIQQSQKLQPANPQTPMYQPPQPQISQQSQMQAQQNQQMPHQQVQMLAPGSGLNPSDVNNISTNTHPPQSQGQYVHTYYSVDSSVYPQYRQSSTQPIRLIVEQGFEEPIPKPNSSPRPSILRKREHDNSPAKGIAKNLGPVLASLQASSSANSPPNSPKNDDGGGHHSSGSTTVSATSSPGLDDEPEQSRITINPSIEMSPRKKPRKQQLTSAELPESRCTEEEMQFIAEDKIKKEIKEELKDKSRERKVISGPPHESNKRSNTGTVKKRPTPSLLGSSWKCKWTGRLNHYKRPSDVKPREERRPTVNEIAQQKQVLQKVNGWKVHHLTAQMEDLAELEKQVHDKLKVTLSVLESQQNSQGRVDDGLFRVNELIKGNMQRSNLISEGMNEARTQLVAIFSHKDRVTEILQRCGGTSNRRTQKKKDK